MDDKIIMISDQDGNLHDSVQASGVLDISDLKRKEIKQLAKKAAGWSGENGTFSWQDIASGQADIQGRFTRHEDLFRRNFNKQLEKNIHHTEQQNLLNAAKQGNAEAMGKYVASKTTDAAPAVGAVTVLPAALLAGLGTGAFATGIQGIKSIYSNPILRTALDSYGTYDGFKNALSDNGLKKTQRLIKEGDTAGAIMSGIGDAFDLFSMVDIGKAYYNLKDFYNSPKTFQYLHDIGDGSLRWNHINDLNVDQTYKNLVREKIITDNDITISERLNEKVTPKIELTNRDISARWGKYLDPNNPFRHKNQQVEDFFEKVGWTKDADPKTISKTLTEWLDPNNSNFNDLQNVLEELRIPVKSELSKSAKRIITDYGLGVKRAKDFVLDHTYKKGTQLPIQRVFVDASEPLVHSLNADAYSKIGFSPDKIISDPDYDFKATLTNVAAHEYGHNNPLYNTRMNLSEIGNVDWQNLTKEQQDLIKKINVESPYYHNDYSNLTERQKYLLKPTIKINDHDFEFSEGYSDLLGTKANMYELGIANDAHFDPNKKYNYFDLLRYKMTPTGVNDRFIKQRGGWWKGWKQQLDALNEIHKNGGKL